MESSELVARGFQLDRCCVCCEITDVRPVEHFDRRSRSRESGRREPSPKSLETDVSAGHAPVAGRLDDLYVVHSNHALAVDVDQLFVEHVLREQHFVLTAHEWTQVENI